MIDERVDAITEAMSTYIMAAVMGPEFVEKASIVLRKAIRTQLRLHGRDVRHACLDAYHSQHTWSGLSNHPDRVKQAIMNVEVK